MDNHTLVDSVIETLNLKEDNNNNINNNDDDNVSISDTNSILQTFVNNYRIRQHQNNDSANDDANNNEEEYDTYDNNEDIENLVISDDNMFRNAVKRLLYVERDLDELNKKAKIMRTMKTALRKKIRIYMERKDLEHLNLPNGGSFVMKKSTRKVNPFSKSKIPKGLINYFHEKKKMDISQAEIQANEIIEYIQENTEKIITNVLRKYK